MVSVRKRKMNRSSVKKATRRVKDRHGKINVKGNPIIAENWDYNATLAQNYKRLGLSVKLDSPAGGIEKDFAKMVKESKKNEDDDEEEEIEKNDFFQETDPEKIPEGEAVIIKDDEGKIKQIIYGKKKKFIDSDDELEPVKPKTKVVEALEAYANKPVVSVERHQSSREKDWLKSLFEKYGDDYEAMKWDKKLNIFQNSAGDLKRKIKKWKKTNKIDQ